MVKPSLVLQYLYDNPHEKEWWLLLQLLVGTHLLMWTSAYVLPAVVTRLNCRVVFLILFPIDYIGIMTKPEVFTLRLSTTMKRMITDRYRKLTFNYDFLLH